MDPAHIDEATRDELVTAARRLHVLRPDLMTKDELRTEILRHLAPIEHEEPRMRSWLGVARDLIANLVEQGLNLPDAAALLRRVPIKPLNRKAPPPVATVTLAGIYAAQGHLERALTVLDEVLAGEPDHAAARRLRARYAAELANLGASAVAARIAPPGAYDSGPPPRIEEAPLGSVDPAPAASVDPTPLGSVDPAPVTVVDAEPPTVPDAAPPFESTPSARDRLTLQRGRGGLTVRWSLSDATRRAASSITLRALYVEPRWSGAACHHVDVALTGADGAVELPLPPDGVLVRAAIGCAAAGGFRALVV